jgi:hypothetical protein
LDPTAADVRRRRARCGREEAGPEHVDCANHRLLAVAGSSAAASSACHAALRRPAVACLGPPLDGLASDADVAEAPHAPCPDAGVGTAAATV